ncbi:MAG: hypothetical protein WC389_01265 [Lutibacter sp.]|jgi:uncharacterized tellurite resistance protein B-like protein
MFSLFTKKRHPASELYDHYSEEEKLTILALLFLAGTCDNDIVAGNRSRINTELSFLNQCVTIFEVKARKSQELLNSVGPDMIITRLTSFDKSKIDIILFMMLEMLLCDGQMNEEEINFLLTILDKFDITQESFMEKMEKNKAINNLFTV